MNIGSKLTVRRDCGFSRKMLGIGCLGIALSLCALSEAHGSTTLPVYSAMGRIERAMHFYLIDNDYRLPASLDALLQFANGHDYTDMGKPLLTKEALIDEWGEPFYYERNKGKYVLISSGPDRKLGTKDDFLRGDVEAYKRGWQPKPTPPVDGQKTNAVQAATAEPVPPPVGTAKVTPSRVPSATTQPPAKPDNPDNPADPKTTPWKIPLLIGIVAIIGALAAWRCFRKKAK